jgi:hypothetical protein
MQAAEDRRRQQEEKQRKEEQREQQLRERQALSYGQVVLDILGNRMTIDEFAGRLLDSRDQGTANPQLKTEWTARGDAYFHPRGNGNGHRKSGGSNGAAGNGGHHNGHNPPAPQPPRRPRPTASPATQDLLGGIATNRPGPGAAAEGGGGDEQP